MSMFRWQETRVVEGLESSGYTELNKICKTTSSRYNSEITQYLLSGLIHFYAFVPDVREPKGVQQQAVCEPGGSSWRRLKLICSVQDRCNTIELQSYL